MSPPYGWKTYAESYLREVKRRLKKCVPYEVRVSFGDGELEVFGEPLLDVGFTERVPISEAKRWNELLKHFVSTLFEKLVLEWQVEGFPSAEVLREDLPLGGLVVKGSGLRLPEGTVCVSKGIFFIPSFLKKQKEFLKDCWRRGARFWSASTVFEGREREVRRELEAARYLNFSYLSQKARSELSLFLNDLEKLRRLKGKRAVVVKKGTYLVTVPKVESQDYLVFRTDDSPFKVLGTSQGLCGGECPVRDGLEGSPYLLAFAACEEARRLGGGFVTASTFTYHILGDLYADWGDLGKALWAYRVAERHPVQPKKLFNSVGLVLKTLDLVEEAIEYFKKALECDPDDPLVNYNLGSTLLKLGDGSAKDYLKKAWKSAPHKRLFAEGYARALFEFGNLEEALEVLEACGSLSLEGQTLLGKVYYQLEREQEAFSTFKKVVSSEEAPGEAFAYLAIFYRKRGESEVAELLENEAQKRSQEVNKWK